MKDVAAASGVSRTTVSLILNEVPNTSIPEATRQKVLQIARQLNYVPHVQATNLAKGKTTLIAFVTRETSEQITYDAFMSGVIRGIIQVIGPYGYHVLVHAVEPDALITTYTQLARTSKVDGLLISLPLINDPDVQMLYEEGFPVVLHGTSYNTAIPSVDVDNVQGAYIATQHLIELGHRRIGHISNAPFSYMSSYERLEGYRKALSDAGIPCEESLIQEGYLVDESGFQPMQKLLNLSSPPTAVFVGSDMVALGAMQAIHRYGLRIPQDISIIGFDDIAVSKYLVPALTTIQVPAVDLGRHSGEMLLNIINGESLSTTRVLLPTRLIVRESTVSPGSSQ